MAEGQEFGFDETQQGQSQAPEDLEQGSVTEPEQGETPEQETQPEIPESLKKFVGDDGALDYDKMQQSYLEQEKYLGRLRNELGQMREAQLRNPGQPNANSSLNHEVKGNRQEESGLIPEDHDGFLSESDVNLIQNLTKKSIENTLTEREKRQMEQLQQQQQERQKAVYNVANQVFRDLQAEDETFTTARIAEIEQMAQQDPEVSQKINQFLSTGQGLTAKDIEEGVKKLNDEVKKKQAKGWENYFQHLNKPIQDAQKQAAATAVSGQRQTNGSGKNSGDDEFSDVPDQLKPLLNGWVT